MLAYQVDSMYMICCGASIHLLCKSFESHIFTVWLADEYYEVNLSLYENVSFESK